jgi:hypothetical protein
MECFNRKTSIGFPVDPPTPALAAHIHKLTANKRSRAQGSVNLKGAAVVANGRLAPI